MTLAAIVERSRAERESWKYTDLTALLKSAPKLPVAARPNVPPAVEGCARFTFVDGALDSTLSTPGDLASGFLQGDAKNGYAIDLQGQTCLITQPVEFVYLASGRMNDMALPLRIDMGANARLTLIQRYHAASGTVMPDIRIKLAAQAKFVHGQMITHDGAASQLATTQVTVAEGGYYDNFALITGGHVTRNEINVTLEGRLAQARLNGAMLLNGTSHADTTTRITHAALHGTSRQLYKTVLANKAHGVFQGKIVVAEGAQKTDGHQLSRALLLSDQAEMDAKPELEIYADDVKCSHGSTVGELDSEALFYLRSRGLDETAARVLLLEAFVGEIVDEVPITEGRAIMRDAITRWLHERR